MGARGVGGARVLRGLDLLWPDATAHRCKETGTVANGLGDWGWHRITIAVGDGQGGELYFGVADALMHNIIRDIEWRLP